MKKAVCFLLALVLLAGASAPCFADTLSAVKASEAARQRSAPRATPVPPSPTPYSAENGEVLLAPDYEGDCEIKVMADEENDYYIYLKYLGESESSSAGRELKEDAEEPYESDLAFYVKAGRRVTKKIPDGVYRFYYARGTEFFGKEKLFGDETACYSADELLDFYTDGHIYILYTVEFYRISDTYFATSAIPQEDFPG